MNANQIAVSSQLFDNDSQLTVGLQCRHDKTECVHIHINKAWVELTVQVMWSQSCILQMNVKDSDWSLVTENENSIINHNN